MLAKRTLFVFTLVILGLGIIALVIFTDTEPVPEPFLCNGQPCNVILIIPESLSARHMGIYGYERDTTPFIDEFFSEESLIFENAWSASSWTVPSFAALFTSQLPSDVFVERREDKLSDEIPTFVDILDEGAVPKFAAYTDTIGLLGAKGGLVTRFRPGEHFKTSRFVDDIQFSQATQWIEEQIQKNPAQSFFLLLQPFAPHSPYHPPEPYRYFFDAPEEYPGPVTDKAIGEAEVALQSGEDVRVELDRFRLQYDQEIRHLDSMFESFISQIPEEVRKNTVFIFTSDHGEALGQHGFLGHIKRPYEEVIHVPFLIRAPGINQKRIQEPITLLDAGPTILDIFSLESPETFQGASFLPLLRGEELQLEERVLRTEYLYYVHPTFVEQLEIEPQVRTEPLPYPKSTAVRKGNWKLLQRGDGSLELYNLEQDPEEQNNLIPQWHDLSREEQAEVIPLFEAVGESPPLY